MVSQCSCCGKTFYIVTNEVLYCTPLCKSEHDLFEEKEGLSLGPVKTSYLTPEQLEDYRKKSTNKAPKRKPQRIADWRWPQNRRKNG